MTGGDFLQRMAAASRARAARAKAALPEPQLLELARTRPAPPALTLGSFDVIAEVKLRSPAAGDLAAPALDRGALIDAYARAGAAAISVLTEPDEFHGDLEHLREAAAGLGARRPVMRKDFLTDPYQVIEARAAGAAGILVIVTMLSDAQVDALVACAAEQGLFVLLEAFEARDLERIAARRLDPRHKVLAGVNSRDLKTLEVDRERFAALAQLLPAHLPAVAESGIGGAADVRRVADLGYRAALVGSALMRTRDPAAALIDLIAAGRAAATQVRSPCS